MSDVLTKMVEGAKGWLNAGLSLVYPEVCDICGQQRATPSQSFVCESCRAQVKFIEPPYCQSCGLPFEGDLTVEFVCTNCRDANYRFAFARSAALAKGPVLEAIHGYKYNGKVWFEKFLAELLVARAVPELASGQWDLLTPTPLFPTKQRERGFNQSEQLAKHLARALKLPMRTDAVRRVIPTRTQTRLDREARKANMRNAFAPAGSLDGTRVILIDDVFTTGATTNACAGALLKAGAATVCVWTVARGI